MSDPKKDSVLKQNCAIREVLDLIAEKWTTLVVYSLSGGTKRYSELKRQIEGVTQKMLTQTLRKLERDGLIFRKVYPVIPPMVEYSLTPLGRTLIKPLGAICQWAEDHFSEVENARKNYENGSGNKQTKGHRPSESKF